MTNINLYDWSQTIGWTLFHSLWQAAIIGGIIWLLFKFISKDNARVRYALSGLGLVLICLASSITFLRYIPKETSATVADLTDQINYSGLTQFNESYLSQLWTYLNAQIENSFPILVNIWLIGMLFLSINLIIKYINAQKLKKHLTFPLRSEYKEIADRIINKYQLKQKVIFKESGFLEIPSVIGYFKPIVLLPVSMLSGIPENQLEIIIAHELAHIRRHDYLLQFIQGIIELVFFYHPVVWWLSSVVNAEREHICDDLAVKICGESLTLIKALNNMEAIRKKQYEMVLGFSGKKGKVLGRIKRILRPKVTISPRRERFMLSGVFTLLFVGLFLISNFAISGNTNIQKTFSKINVLDQKNFQEAISPEANSTITEQDKRKKKNQKKNDELQLVEEVEAVQELELVKEVDAVKETKSETSVTAMSVSPIDSHDFEFPKDSVKSEKWVKMKADEIIREQMEEMKSAAKDMQEMKFDFDLDKMKKELKESLKHLDFNSEEFQNEMKEQESEIEEQLKELSDENYLKEFEKERELQKKELKNQLKEIEKSSELNKKEKENIKARLKESVERMNSTEFQNKLKKQLEKAKESLEKHQAEFKSGEFKQRIEEQRENIKRELKRIESAEFKENMNQRIQESKKQIQEHIKRINSDEYRKELEENIQKRSSTAPSYGDSKIIQNRFHLGLTPMGNVRTGYHIDSITPMSNVKVGYPMPKSTVRTGFRVAPSYRNITPKNGQPLIVLDGKTISRETMDQIPPNEIAKINVLKDATATALYGTVGGANGVILITSKSEANKLKADSVVVIGYGKSKGNVRTGYKGPMRIKSSSLSEDPTKQPLIIIDGKKVSNEAMENIPPESIESISVLKDASAINKYGKEGANGVVLITSKALNNKSQSSVRMKFGSDKNSPLFIVDGKKISPKKAEKIDPNKIESIDVLKGQNAIDQYGKKAKNGVVYIRMKK
jgi:bla regulator protein blaR1